MISQGAYGQFFFSVQFAVNPTTAIALSSLRMAHCIDGFIFLFFLFNLSYIFCYAGAIHRIFHFERYLMIAVRPDERISESAP